MSDFELSKESIDLIMCTINFFFFVCEYILDQKYCSNKKPIRQLVNFITFF